jgi:hypothetical protein
VLSATAVAFQITECRRGPEPGRATPRPRESRHFETGKCYAPRRTHGVMAACRRQQTPAEIKGPEAETQKDVPLAKPSSLHQNVMEALVPRFADGNGRR